MSTLTSIGAIRSPSGGSCRGLSSGEQVGVPAQVERPAALGVDALADGLPTLEVAVEVAVLKHHARPLGCLGDEPNLDLAGLVGVGLDLPLRGDVPADHEAVRRVVGEDARPAALASVDAAVVEMTARMRLKDRLGDVDG